MTNTIDQQLRRTAKRRRRAARAAAREAHSVALEVALELRNPHSQVQVRQESLYNVTLRELFCESFRERLLLTGDVYDEPTADEFEAIPTEVEVEGRAV